MYSAHILLTYRGPYSQIWCIHLQNNNQHILYPTLILPCRGRGECPQLRHVPQSPHSPVGTRSSIGTTHKLLGKIRNYTVMKQYILTTTKEKKHRYTMNLRWIRPTCTLQVPILLQSPKTQQSSNQSVCYTNVPEGCSLQGWLSVVPAFQLTIQAL